MNDKRILLYLLLLLILISGCSSQESSSSGGSAGDWAYNFVVWNGDIYEILNEEVNTSEIEGAIGEVKQYSDYEGIYSDGFSNKYQAGTNLYKIKDLETSVNIAIETEEGHYIKAKDHGKYKGK